MVHQSGRGRVHGGLLSILWISCPRGTFLSGTVRSSDAPLTPYTDSVNTQTHDQRSRYLPAEPCHHWHPTPGDPGEHCHRYGAGHCYGF